MTEHKRDDHRVVESNAADVADVSLTCAIGDVHGHIDKLTALLDLCERRAGHDARLVFIGDYIDRGPDSRAVVELMMDLQQRRPDSVICLRGNHEAVAVAAANNTLSTLPGDIDHALWLSDVGGGLATLASYGVADAAELPASHLDWMAALPLCYDDGQRYFAHAGVHPRRPLAAQQEEDLVWIREPFLSHSGDYGRLVVHGHTPVAARIPELHANRLNIDTGAGYGGPLTAAIFDACRREPIGFLTNCGEIAIDALVS